MRDWNSGVLWIDERPLVKPSPPTPIGVPSSTFHLPAPPCNTPQSTDLTQPTFPLSMPLIHSLAVYCGSSPGNNPRFIQAAVQTGQTLAQRQIRLIYGGGGVGMMGAIADATLASGGHVTGIIPTFLDTRELKHPHVTDIHVTNTMHERKLLMVEKSQAFIALPGGYGTLDELFEVLTWAQLRIHQHPVGLLNVDGFFDPLLAFLDHLVSTDFLTAQDRARILTSTDINHLIDQFQTWTPPTDTKFHLARRVEI